MLPQNLEEEQEICHDELLHSEGEICPFHNTGTLVELDGDVVYRLINPTPGAR
jgi:hypothetical protein